ncbi:MAG: AbrB/MazE/SpoVT family DNA-binding domain-containing protein [Verrucomicrobiota bacterium]|jgi:AbrB family looped-hinge helix DNA binding protein
MSTATISTKGQLVIPRRFRKALHLQTGDEVAFSLEGEKLILQRDEPPRARLVEKNGCKVLVAPPGAPPMTPEVVKRILADVTDAYLVEMARAHGLRLATLDDELCKKPGAVGTAENPL